MLHVAVLHEINLSVELAKIKSRGYIRSLRKGDTGVGYTIETLLKIPENNVGEPDCLYRGIPVELKGHRTTTRSMITLFTKEPIKGVMNDKRMIQNYGYIDGKGRKALKVTLNTKTFVRQGLKIVIEEEKKISVVDRAGNKPWFWKISDLKLKIQNMVLVFVGAKKIGGHEHFLCRQAYFLGELDESCFFQLIDQSRIRIDLRMHIRARGSVRNRGTAFRLCRFEDILRCFRDHERLL